MKTIVPSVVGCLLLLSISTLAFRGRPTDETDVPVRIPVRTGQVVAHTVGRLLVDDKGSAQFIGYYPYILGINGSLFSGAPSEATAYFTFRSSSFDVEVLPNGNLMHVFAVPPNGTANLLNVYLNENPSQNFDNPDSFSSGRLVAQFQTERSMVTYFGNGASQLGTIDLIASTSFNFRGRLYNLGQIKSATVEAGFSGTLLSGTLPGGPAVTPFGGSLLAVGPTNSPEREENSDR